MESQSCVIFVLPQEVKITDVDVSLQACHWWSLDYSPGEIEVNNGCNAMGKHALLFATRFYLYKSLGECQRW